VGGERGVILIGVAAPGSKKGYPVIAPSNNATGSFLFAGIFTVTKTLKDLARFMMP
jgi:hypothetical protein